MMKKGANTLELTFPSDREVVVERVFDAPRELVFDAWTKPEHVVHWYGCRNSSLASCEIDLRPGGTWRFVLRCEGADHPVGGVYREVVRPEKLVYTEALEELAGSDALVTTRFEDLGGRTRLVSHAVYDSAEVVETIVKMGMREGTVQTFERLDEYIAAGM